MRKQFLLNIVFLILLNILIKPFWILGIDRTIQNTVGAEEYGWYFALFGFSFLFNSLLDLGVTNFSVWSIARESSFLKVGFLKLSKLKAVLGLLYLAVTLFAAILSGYDSESFKLLFLLSINQFLLSYILFQRSVLAGLHIFWLDSIFSVLDKLLLIGFCSFLLWFSTLDYFKIEWLVYAQLTAYLLTLVTLVLINWTKKSPLKTVNHKNWEYKELLTKSYPFAVIVLFMTFYYRIDAFMIERMLQNGAEAAGHYAQSFRLLDVVNNFIFLFTGMLFPVLAKSFYKGTSNTQLIDSVMRLLIFPTLLFIPLSISSGTRLIELLYQVPAQNGGAVLIAFAFAFVGMVLTSIYGTVLTAQGALKKMIRITLLGFVINLILNAILIPLYGIIGAAVVSACSQLLIGVLLLITCAKMNLIVLKISWFGKFLSVLILLTGYSIIACPIIKQELFYIVFACLLTLSFFILNAKDLGAITKLLKT